jgi:hypothetical protein
LIPILLFSYFACDTEVIGVDVKKESPVGKGQVICFSIYCGEDIDFGNGPRLWVDTLGQCAQTLQYFKQFFEDPGHIFVEFHFQWLHFKVLIESTMLFVSLDRNQKSFS